VSEVEVEGRKLKVLSSVVEIYVKTSRPVSSFAVCKMLNNTVSPATVRNEMASLMFSGFLEQPHASSGRVPSVLGLRTYIDNSMPRKVLTSREKSIIDGMLCEQFFDAENVMCEAAKILAVVTGCAVAFTAPASFDSCVRGVKFVQISLRTAMIVLTTSSGSVQNRMFGCKFKITEEILKIFSEVISEKFIGKSLSSLLPESLGTVFDRAGTDVLIAPAFEAAMKAVRRAYMPQTGLEGRSNLFTVSSNPIDAVSVLEFFADEKSVSKLLLSGRSETQVFVGDETGVSIFKDWSVIISKYSIGGRHGAIAVVGSVYLDYSDAIAKLEYAARAAENIFSEIMSMQ
jgi:heat-inducible transcriptional repressor